MPDNTDPFFIETEPVQETREFALEAMRRLLVWMAEGPTLEERVKKMSGEIESRLGVLANVKVSADIDNSVGPRCAQHCVQALREILSNVVRHSEASAVEIKAVCNQCSKVS